MKNIMGIGLILVCIIFMVNLSAHALDPLDQAQLFMEKGLYQQSIELLLPLLESRDEDRVSQAVEILYALYSIENEPERSIEVLNYFIASFPDSHLVPLYLYWAAKLEEDIAQYNQAEQRYKIIIEEFLLPEKDIYEVRPMAMEDLAHLYGSKEAKYTEAIELYQRLLTEYPDLASPTRIKLEIGSLYERKGDIEKAITVYTEVLEHSASYADRNLASLRLTYLRSDPTWTRDSTEKLAEELINAFKDRNTSDLNKLARKGDFWVGQMYSEFDVMEYALIEPYLERYLGDSILVFERPERVNGEVKIRITGWADPEYDILYLLLVRGLFGWEWKGIILSNRELEEAVGQNFRG